MTHARNASRSKLRTSAALLTLALAMAAGPAAAAGQADAAKPVDAAAAPQDSVGLEEIIVTAQRRSENLQSVPIAVAAVTAQALRETGVDSTRDLPQLVPSVQFTRSGASGLIFIRGVGTTNAAVGEESSNAVYVDGVYLVDLAQAINNFNNIERIEVLKGPQGTLFGRNATGGLIHIITREPGDKLVVNGEVGYGNYETIGSRLYLASPITDGISADLAVTKTHQNDGWGRNLTLNRKNKIQDNWGARSKLVLRASEAVKFVLAGDYYKNRDNLGLGYRLDKGVIGTGGITGPTGQDTNLNDYPLTQQKIYGGSLTGSADLGFATLTSISAIRRSKNHSDFDVDGGPLPLIRIAFTSGAKSTQQELRLASNDRNVFSWQVGAFYLNAKASNDSNFTGAAFAPIRGQHIVADLDTDSYAAFAEATYAITPTTKLTGGARYTKDKRDFVGTQANVTLAGVELTPGRNAIPKLRYSAWTYRVALRQEITADVSAYASFNRGFKSGSYSLQSPLNAPYLPQYINAYEVGLKSEWFDRRLRLNLSAYHYDIDNYQVRSAAVANPGASLILNAATVKVNGADVEFEAAPADKLRLFGGFTWLHSRFDTFGGPGAANQAPIVYPNANSSTDPTMRTRCPAAQLGTANPGVVGTGPITGGFTTCFGDVSGNRTPNAPTFTGSFGASYAIPVGERGELRLAALYSYNSGYVFEPDNRAKQGNYSLLNGSIEYRPTETVGLMLWGRNLADTEYAVQKLTTATGTVATLGAPRTYGLTVKFDY
jgi:iron complex outermembrane receptor protein